MIAGAALLVLLGLGLFVAGVLTGVTTLYWGCVAVCVVAAVLLLLARRQLSAAAPPPGTEPPGDAAAPAGTGPGAGAGSAAGASGATAAGRGPAGDTATAAPAPGTAAPVAAQPSRAVPEKADGPAAHAAPLDLPDPPVEEVEVTDLLLVVDLTDEVLVVDEHPRYHLAGCRHLAGRTTIPLPLDEARADGFTPCAVCAPDRHLAERARARR